ncbi:hypothetical protein POX_c03657 [Penicillium oxalicum]|uniref:Uncharacterized protein n=1 Tax=Penicillium oxalicum (strain 114-2 / CGMCC 5302) TaxID=933388 RepID=S8AHQ9_PENO1|nr:hypothetical protein POX_c03657 [Penicillium oxalicum]EPS25253.1 hypothetical protein PDE_00186 [Penicillium oxalicum 114-2]KAI2790806.1 hypothetical protein POX_c03657 [Penicillium oxalicum]
MTREVYTTFLGDLHKEKELCTAGSGPMYLGVAMSLGASAPRASFAHGRNPLKIIGWGSGKRPMRRFVLSVGRIRTCPSMQDGHRMMVPQGSLPSFLMLTLMMERSEKRGKEKKDSLFSVKCKVGEHIRIGQSLSRAAVLLQLLRVSPMWAVQN